MNLQSSFRAFLPKCLRQAYRNIKLLFTADLDFMLKRLDYDEKDLRGIAGLLLHTQYPEIYAPRQGKSQLNAYEGKVYSQYNEDGILLHLFSTLGVTNRRFVEFGVSDGRENQSALFALIFGWTGIVIEGDPVVAQRARNFYASMLPGPAVESIHLVEKIVTAENIDQILKQNQITGEIDLLSIDIDSNDYWVWKAISSISPRVVVIEYNGALGNHEPLTIPYTPNFDRFKAHPAGLYYGTSLKAAIKLGEEKGYIFVGCESTGGVNAFFIRKDIADGKFSAITADEGFYPQARRSKGQSVEDVFAKIKHLPLELV